MIKDYIDMRRNNIAGTLSKWREICSLNVGVGKSFWVCCQEIEGVFQFEEPNMDTLETFYQKYLEK